MTMFQRNKVNYHLRNGEPLPPPRTSAAANVGPADYEEQLAGAILSRAKSARKRTLDAITASGALEPDRYVPLHHLREPSGVQKQRLQETMSGSKDYPELASLRLCARDKHRRRTVAARANVDPVEEREWMDGSGTGRIAPLTTDVLFFFGSVQ